MPGATQKGTRGAGATFLIDTVPISGIKTIQRSGGKNDRIDVTTLDSTGQTREYITGLKDYGEWSLGLVRNPTDPGQIALEAAFVDGLVHPFTITFPMQPGAQTLSGDKYTFSAIIVEVNNDVQSDKEITTTAKVSITGVMTKVAGS